MSTKETCRNCKHCCFAENPSDGWCRLRQISVHKEIALFAFCHHWTKKPPSLPKLQENITQVGVARQLEFNRALVSTDI